MAETEEARFDHLLKVMASGRLPNRHRESEGPAIAKQRADREDKRRKEC